MTKVLLETTSNIFLIDPNTGHEIDDQIPTLTVWTAFLEQRAGLGQVRVLHRGFKEEASNADWVEHLKAAGPDMQFAIDSFISEWGLSDKPGTKKVAPVVEKKVDEIAPSKLSAKKG